MYRTNENKLQAIDCMEGMCQGTKFHPLFSQKNKYLTLNLLKYVYIVSVCLQSTFTGHFFIGSEVLCPGMNLRGHLSLTCCTEQSSGTFLRCAHLLENIPTQDGPSKAQSTPVTLI